MFVLWNMRTYFLDLTLYIHMPYGYFLSIFFLFIANFPAMTYIFLTFPASFYSPIIERDLWNNLFSQFHSNFIKIFIVFKAIKKRKKGNYFINNFSSVSHRCLNPNFFSNFNSICPNTYYLIYIWETS